MSVLEIFKIKPLLILFLLKVKKYENDLPSAIKYFIKSFSKILISPSFIIQTLTLFKYLFGFSF